MKRPRVMLGVSIELERQPPAPYIVIGVFEDAHRFGRRLNGSYAELIQPALERAGATRDGVAQFGHHLDTAQDTPTRGRAELLTSLPRAPRRSRPGAATRTLAVNSRALL